jgi:hypothetical protein
MNRLLKDENAKGKKVEHGELKATERGELIGIDVMTGLPRTKDGSTGWL